MDVWLKNSKILILIFSKRNNLQYFLCSTTYIKETIQALLSLIKISNKFNKVFVKVNI